MKKYSFILALFNLILFSARGQQWSIEPNLGLRFDLNNVKVQSGDVDDFAKGLPSFGITLNRESHPKVSQGFGILFNGYGNSLIVEGVNSNPFTQSGLNRWLWGILYQQRYSLLNLGKYDVQVDIGSQLVLTKSTIETSLYFKNPIFFPFELTQVESGKFGVSPIPFVRLGMCYNVNRRFSTFFRGQLNVGTRALYTSDVVYSGQTTTGSAIIKHRGTGTQVSYGIRVRM